MKRVDDVPRVSESSRPFSSPKQEKTLKPECVASLTARVVGWSVYASVVWAAIGRFMLGEAAATLTVPWILAAIFCVSSGASAFAVAAYFRYRGEICVGEAFYGIWARTGVFCLVALAFVVAGEPTAVRTGLTALLFAYFATAPLHLAAIFPIDERRLKRWKKREKRARQTQENDSNDEGE